MKSKVDNNMRLESAFAQDGTTKSKWQVICYCCGGAGHTSSNCDECNKMPKDEWHVKRALQNMQEVSHGDSEESALESHQNAMGCRSKTSSGGWCG